MTNFVRMSVPLFLVCVAAASALALVNKVTKDRIVQNEIAERQGALKEVFAAGTEYKEVVNDRRWEVYNEGEKVGNVFVIMAPGYSGHIHVMFGLDAENQVTGVRILSHTETPGLGAKVALTNFLDQFKEKKAEELFLKNDSTGGTINAVTAATISSRAVANNIRSAIDSYMKGELE